MSQPTLQMYGSKNMPTWCPGCGDFQIWMAIKKALVNLNIFPEDVLFVFDVGCNGNMSDKIGGYRFHSLHGRVVPLAVGASVANRNIKVIGFGGDGGVYGEGVNHFIHAIRSNYDCTLIVHNNGNYGLTTGQATPTTPHGLVMNSSPHGVIEDSLNPIDMAFSLRASFIAREFSQEMDALVQVFESAIMHQGFSYVDVIQNCPTYDKAKMFHQYLSKRTPVENIKDYNISDYQHNRSLCLEVANNIYTGVLYRDVNSLSFYDRLPHRQDIKTQLSEEVKHYSVGQFLEKLV